MEKSVNKLNLIQGLMSMKKVPGQVYEYNDMQIVAKLEVEAVPLEEEATKIIIVALTTPPPPLFSQIRRKNLINSGKLKRKKSAKT